MTRAAAIVSPIARPSPSKTPPVNPWRECGNTVDRIISQRVQPSASAASFCPAGVVSKTSRVMTVMIGVIINARIRPQVKRERPDPPPPPLADSRLPMIGIGCATPAARSNQCWRIGASVSTPHRPNTTEGTAARRSTRKTTGRRSQRGAYSVTNRAMPTLTGTAKTTATTEEMTVP